MTRATVSVPLAGLSSGHTLWYSKTAFRVLPQGSDETRVQQIICDGVDSSIGCNSKQSETTTGAHHGALTELNADLLA